MVNYVDRGSYVGPTGVAFLPVTTFDEDGELDERQFKGHVSTTIRRVIEVVSGVPAESLWY